jgi:hypothetical protein
MKGGRQLPHFSNRCVELNFLAPNLELLNDNIKRKTGAAYFLDRTGWNDDRLWQRLHKKLGLDIETLSLQYLHVIGQTLTQPGVSG